MKKFLRTIFIVWGAILSLSFFREFSSKYIPKIKQLLLFWWFAYKRNRESKQFKEVYKRQANNAN